MSYIQFAITEYNGETEHETDMVAEIPDDTTDDHIELALREFLCDWYSDCSWDESDTPAYKVWTPHGTLCWITENQTIPKSEFEVLRKHMNCHSPAINACLTKVA